MTTKTLPLALAIAALAVMTTGVQAAPLDQVQIDRPVVKVIGRDWAIDAPIEKVTVTARVIPDPETLTTDSGVKLLNDYIREAARRACFDAGPMVPDDGTCYRNAIASARPQVAALVAHARAAKSEAAAS